MSSNLVIRQDASIDQIIAPITDVGDFRNEIIFVDAGVEDASSLLAGIPSSTRVVWLDATRDGVKQIAEALIGQSNVDAIHIVSHGDAGRLLLGSSTLSGENLVDYADDLKQIGSALSEQGDLLLYGCNVAQGEAGTHFIQSLAQLTGADVAASDDLTGHDGDWLLEAQTGSIEISSLNENISYQHNLAYTSTALDFSAIDRNMWGSGTALNLDVTWDDLLYTDSISQSFSGYGFSGTADLAVNAGLVAHLTGSAGDIDLNYGVSVNVLTPDIVKSGDYFIVDTSSWSLTNGLLKSLGPDVAFNLDFLFNVNAGLNNLQYDPPPIRAHSI
ncbi:DUF4347 domain-containing protein [Crenothrix sp.]|uniref:DUF4347 domain-containing protein n=1 Tax=Crenothrix sp. TaxID=3100433 RepID=UPI00374D22D8